MRRIRAGRANGPEGARPSPGPDLLNPEVAQEKVSGPGQVPCGNLMMRMRNPDRMQV